MQHRQPEPADIIPAPVAPGRSAVKYAVTAVALGGAAFQTLLATPEHTEIGMWVASAFGTLGVYSAFSAEYFIRDYFRLRQLTHRPRQQLATAPRQLAA